MRLCAIVVLTLLTAGCVRQNDETPAAPALSGETTHDFGMIELRSEQAMQTHEFRLVNTSKEAVVIEDVAGSCGCVSARASRTHVPAGESTDINVTLALTKAGRTSQEVVILTQHDAPPIRLSLSATVHVAAGSIDTNQRVVSMKTGESRTVVVTVRTDAGEWPAELRVAPYAGINVLPIEKWERVYEAETVARWQTQITLLAHQHFVDGDLQLACGAARATLRAIHRD